MKPQISSTFDLIHAQLLNICNVVFVSGVNRFALIDIHIISVIICFIDIFIYWCIYVLIYLFVDMHIY